MIRYLDSRLLFTSISIFPRREEGTVRGDEKIATIESTEGKRRKYPSGARKKANREAKVQHRGAKGWPVSFEGN